METNQNEECVHPGCPHCTGWHNCRHNPEVWTKAARASPSTSPAPPAAGEAGERVREIRERLAAATPGPWYTVDQPWGKGNWVSTAQDPHAGHAICDCQAPPFEEDDEWEESEYANAAFIAQAPEDIRYLLARLHAAEAELTLRRALHPNHRSS